MSIQNQNPLAAFFRQPKIYISLPSKGEFYPAGAVEIPESGEIPVYAMTARDELLFKTPDALMNGAATVEVIKSCIPAIKDPWKMPSVDVDSILCAIRIATYGVEMDVTSRCPKCETENERSLDLRNILDNLRSIKFNKKIEVGSDILINLKPMTYDQMTKTAIKAFEHQRVFTIINDDKISDEDKVRLFEESFIKLTDMTFDIVANCIESIESTAGNTNDPAHIREFLRQTEQAVFTKINDEINKSKETGTMPSLDTSCDKCGHEFKLALTLDQADFFGRGFR